MVTSAATPWGEALEYNLGTPPDGVSGPAGGCPADDSQAAVRQFDRLPVSVRWCW